MARKWSVEETIIAIYFSSRCICPRSIRSLLLRRGYDRSTRAIEHKISCTAQGHPHLRPSKGHWDLDAVDWWLDDLLSHESVNKLIPVSPQDVEDVATVTLPTLSHSLICVDGRLAYLEPTCRRIIEIIANPQPSISEPGGHVTPLFGVS